MIMGRRLPFPDSGLSTNLSSEVFIWPEVEGKIILTELTVPWGKKGCEEAAADSKYQQLVDDCRG